MATKGIRDGLEALKEELNLEEIMRLIERTAQWVDVATFKKLPVWYPEHARGGLFFKDNWSEPQMNKSRATGLSVHKREANVYANKALTLALGLRSRNRPNWSCCHIWGLDDPAFQIGNAIVRDSSFYSCVANMVLLPTPLKAFTDSMPEVKAMLRICSRNYYGWHCDHESLADAVTSLDGWTDWKSYPVSWPRKQGDGIPLGVVPLNATIVANIEKRRNQIRRDLDSAGCEYPRTDVHRALKYWGINL